MKYPFFLSDFNENWIFSTVFLKKKSTNFKFHENPFSGSRVVPRGQTDMTTPAVAFRNFANANWWVDLSVPCELPIQRRDATFWFLTAVLLKIQTWRRVDGRVVADVSEYPSYLHLQRVLDPFSPDVFVCYETRSFITAFTKAHYSPALTQINPVCTFPQCLFNIHFSIVRYSEKNTQQTGTVPRHSPVS